MKKKTYAVIGHPIGHTMSPFIHNRLFELAGIDAEYSVLDIAPEDLGARFKEELKMLDAKSAFNALVKQVCIDVSEKLNNTASVCKTSYIDPYLWDYMYDIAFPEK